MGFVSVTVVQGISTQATDIGSRKIEIWSLSSDTSKNDLHRMEVSSIQFFLKTS